jgi:hypothetical protein
MREHSRKEPPMRNLTTFIMATILALASCAPQPATLTFDPPYPETNANGDPILAEFEGRIPSSSTDYEKLKVGLVLYQDRNAKTPTTYWLGIIGMAGNARVVTQGKWTIHRGVKDYPDATTYELDAAAPPDLRRYWRVSEDILLPLDENMSPKPGNAAWGYMLSRYAEPYGPRTYDMTKARSR